MFHLVQGQPGGSVRVPVRVHEIYGAFRIISGKRGPGVPLRSSGRVRPEQFVQLRQVVFSRRRQALKCLTALVISGPGG